SDVVYDVPVNAPTGVLHGELAGPTSFSPGMLATVGLALRPGGDRPWTHPWPYRPASATVQWREENGRDRVASQRVLLPVVLLPDRSYTIPLVTETPTAPGPYYLAVSVADRPGATASRPVSVEAGRLPDSAQDPHLLAAAYARSPAVEQVDVRQDERLR